jgi:hypothetical protein
MEKSMKKIIATIVGAGLLLGLSSGLNASQKNERLGASEIKRDIIGKRIFIQVPLGGEIPLIYQRNGVVKGDGEGVGLGRFMTPNDQGRWWVDGRQLCQQWQEWYDGKTFCFELSDYTGDSVKWYRDDGRTGVARVGN